MRVRLTRDFTFEAAHLLPKAPEGHKCRRLHGHSFRVEITVEGDVDPATGWFLDYGEITRLVEPGHLSLRDALARLSWQPARIAGLDARGHGLPVAPGHPANLCVIDPAATWVVEPERLASRSRNTPYAGRKLTGRVRHTVLDGEPVVIDGEAQR